MGRDLRPDGPKDQVLVNEKMVEAIGWKNPIGQVVPFRYGEVDHPVVAGVLKDFVYLLPSAPLYLASRYVTANGESLGPVRS